MICPKHAFRLFVITCGITVGVVITLLLTAKSPDIDEFTRGVPAGIVGAAVGWILRGILPVTIATEKNDAGPDIDTD